MVDGTRRDPVKRRVYGAVLGFGRWRIQRSWRRGQLGVVKWRVVVDCLFVWNFSVTSSTVLTKVDRRNIPGLAKLLRALPKLSIDF